MPGWSVTGSAVFGPKVGLKSPSGLANWTLKLGMTGALVMYNTWHTPSFSLERKNCPTATLRVSDNDDPSERITADPRRTVASVEAPMH